jgi:hypothetical protein
LPDRLHRPQSQSSIFRAGEIDTTGAGEWDGDLSDAWNDSHRWLLTIVFHLTTAAATTFTFVVPAPYQTFNTTLQIVGTTPDRFNLDIFANGGPTITGSTFDPSDPNFSSTSLFLSLSGQAGFIEYQFFNCSEFDFHCSRQDSVGQTPDFIGGPQTLEISAGESAIGTYAAYGPLTVSVFIKDGIKVIDPNIAAVPESPIWAMLLIGLAGVGFMAYAK